MSQSPGKSVFHRYHDYCGTRSAVCQGLLLALVVLYPIGLVCVLVFHQVLADSWENRGVPADQQNSMSGGIVVCGYICPTALCFAVAVGLIVTAVATLKGRKTGG